MSKNKQEIGAIEQNDWIHGETHQITVPIALSDQILAIARILDRGESLEDFIQSKKINLSGVSIRYFKGGAAVYLKDLLNAGYKIRPISLVDKIRKDIDREKSSL